MFTIIFGQKLRTNTQSKKYLGDSLGLEHIFCWLREIWDYRDGSRIVYYTDLARAKAEKKLSL